MTVTDALLRCMLELGLSESGAMFHVEKIRVGVERDIERIRRHKVCRDLLGKDDWSIQAMERLGVCRSSVYKYAKTKSAKIEKA